MTHAEEPEPWTGASVDQLDTPVLAVELPIFEANLERFAALCREHGKAWRPHFKGHRSSHIARRLVDVGALGATCAKLGEAEILASAGVTNLLVANQVVGPRKVARWARLLKQARVIVCVDDGVQAVALDEAAGATGVQGEVLIELNLGLNRAGVPDGSAVMELAHRIAELRHLKLVGLMGYEGHLLTVADPQQKRGQIAAALAQLAAAAADLRAAGWECPIVSAGGTGSSAIALSAPGITELQSGGVIFMDAFYRQACQVRDFEFALQLWSTVTSRPAPGRAILDAGRKTQSVEIHLPWFPDYPHLAVTQTSAEHCRVEWPAELPGPRIGERVRLVPGYADLTCSLHQRLFAVDQGRVQQVWQLDAHGAST